MNVKTAFYILGGLQAVGGPIMLALASTYPKVAPLALAVSGGVTALLTYLKPAVPKDTTP